MTPQHRTRSNLDYFPFVELPADLQLLVLGNLDLHALQIMVREVPGAKELLLVYPTIIWQVATTSMGPQIHNLLLTIFRLAHSIKSVQAGPQPDITNIKQFPAEVQDTEELRKPFSDVVQGNVLGALGLLCDIDVEVATFVQECAQRYYEHAWGCDTSAVARAPVKLSSTETYRLTRAFYRLKLFGVLFCRYLTQFGLDVDFPITDFFSVLSAFELDEMIVAYHFLYQNSRYFPLSYMWKDYVGAVPTPSPMDRSRIQQSCCHASIILPYICSPNGALRLFWDTLVKGGYCDRSNHWAKPLSCLPMPLKTWGYVPAANGPSAGWLLWSELRDSSMWHVEGSEYVDYFSNLGYCFWDATRLESFEVFSEAWFKQKRDAESKMRSIRQRYIAETPESD